MPYFSSMSVLFLLLLSLPPPASPDGEQGEGVTSTAAVRVEKGAASFITTDSFSAGADSAAAAEVGRSDRSFILPSWRNCCVGSERKRG